MSEQAAGSTVYLLNTLYDLLYNSKYLWSHMYYVHSLSSPHEIHTHIAHKIVAGSNPTLSNPFSGLKDQVFETSKRLPGF